MKFWDAKNKKIVDQKPVKQVAEKQPVKPVEEDKTVKKSRK